MPVRHPVSVRAPRGALRKSLERRFQPYSDRPCDKGRLFYGIFVLAACARSRPRRPYVVSCESEEGHAI